ncbi:MAG: nucleoside-triphosphatase [Melioribacteraceae bacterium]|nr:nucleoside-triphosphatase [Melioribacteraceae bacterium]MCF8353613.1 nucleoside-triphosphatase [Melioribacteraceae bacterium]MCF8393536.1 nucleoside-triphosphatase [Melioribacteraceae bacterium]MCF8419346.1 nucleoside-triphosphatase [Melioribacteraceae bacterium]
MGKIYLVTGPIQTGKTTKLSEWVKHRNCAGILQPVIEGKRHVKNIKTGEVKLLETKDAANAVAIGKFLFDKNVIAWTKEILNESIQSDADYIIIDEYGKLEMKNEGLEPAAGEIIRNTAKSNYNTVIVVRNYLKEKFLKKFDNPVVEYLMKLS